MSIKDGMGVSFLSHNSEVTVEVLEDLVEHVHEENLESLSDTSSNSRRTDKITRIISNDVHKKPNQIKRLLKNTNVFVGRKLPPSSNCTTKLLQLGSKFFPLEVLEIHMG